LSQWSGLVGVALGALLGIVASWAQRRWSEADRRRQELGTAVDDLRGSAQTLMMALEASEKHGDSESALTFWLPMVMAQLERLQKAAEIIMRRAQPELGALASAVASEVVIYAASTPSQRDGSKINKTIAKFTEEARKTNA
jgi:hypothetical protein